MAQAQFKLRMPEALRASLEEAARPRGVSVNAEIVQRLERSFAEEQGFGGPEMRRLAYLMIVAFARAGQLRAAGKTNWIDDRDCYRAGMFGAIDALLIGLPDATAEEVMPEIEGLKGRLLSRIAREEQNK
jgi:Arc-like DNA binding domain